MSTTVDERVVSMRFDNRRFEQNAQTSINTLDRLKQSLRLKDASRGFEEVNNASGKVNFTSMSEAIDSVRVKMSAMQTIAVGALMSIGAAAVSAGAKIAKSLAIDPITMGLSEYETQLNSVQTILSNTKHKGTTMSDVNDALDELNLYADKTIYNFQEMARNIGTFTAAGIDLDTSVSAIKGIANLAAVSGSNSHQAATAMYQLSQALATGTVRLMDWNSVVNAGMGGEVFQNAIKESARVHGVAVDDIIAKEGSFRDSLQQGWLTTDILMDALSKFTGDLSVEQLKAKGYTEEQAKAIQELGQDANNAATKVKTFTQLMSTLKESAQSGWAQTFEIVIGDFEEAKKLWTEVNESVGGFINDTSKWRNELLTSALGSGYDQFMAAGIPNEEEFKKSISAIAKNHGISIDEMIKKEGSLEAALTAGIRDGSITPDILHQSVLNLQALYDNMTAEQRAAAGYTEENAKQLNALADGFKNGTMSVRTFTDAMNKLSGRELIIESLKNAFNYLKEVLKPIKDAFLETFSLPTSGGIYACLEAIHNFTKGLKVTEEQATAIKNTFKGVFSVIKILWNLLKGITIVVFKLVGVLFDLFGGVTKITGVLGEYISKISEAIDKNEIFAKGASGITKVITVITDAFKSVIKWFKNIDFSPVVSFFLKVWDAVKPVGMYIIDMIKELGGTIAEIIESGDWKKLFAIINSITTTGIGVLIMQIVSNVKKATDSGLQFKDRVLKILDSVKNCFTEWQKTLKANRLKQIGKAILMIAAAMLILSFIPIDRIIPALLGMSGVIVALNVSMKSFSKFCEKMDDAKRMFPKVATLMGMATSILIMSAAIFIIAKAMQAVGSLGVDKGIVGIVAIAVAFGGIIGLLFTLSKVSDKIDESKIDKIGRVLIKLGGSLALASIGLIGVAAAIKIISTIDDPGQMASSVAVIMGVIAMFALATKIMPKEGEFIKFGVCMLLMGVALNLAAAAFKILSTIKDWGDIARGAAALGGTIAVLTGAVVATRMLPEKSQIARFGGVMIMLGVALNVAALAFKIISTMNWGDIARGGAALGGTIAVLTGALIATKLFPEKSQILRFASTMIILSVALNAFAAAFKIVSTMNWGGIARGAAALGGTIAVLTGALLLTQLFPEKSQILRFASSMIILSAALNAMAVAFKIISTIDWSGVFKGLVAFSTTLGLFTAAIVILTRLTGNSVGVLGAASSIVIMASSLVVLAIALKLMSTIPGSRIAAGVLAIAGALTALVLVAKFGASTVFVIQQLAASLIKISASVAILGVGLVLASLGLATFVNTLGKVITSLLKLIPSIVKLIVEFITTIIVALADNIPRIADGILRIISGILGVILNQLPLIGSQVIEIILSLIKLLTQYTPKIVDAIIDAIIALVDSVIKNLPRINDKIFALVEAIFVTMADAISKIDMATILEGTKALGGLLGMMAILNAAALLAPGAIIGAILLTAVVAEVAGLAMFIANNEYLMSGLASLGKVFGTFLGEFMGAFSSSSAKYLPSVGESMSEFMTAVKPFFTGLESIPTDAILKTGLLAGVVTMFGVASFVAGIGKIATFGAGCLGVVGEDLGKFMKNAKPFFEGLNVVPNDAAAKSASLALAVTMFGVASFVAGIAKIASFGAGCLGVVGSDLGKLMTNMKPFLEGLSLVKPDLIDSALTITEMLLIFSAADFLSGITNLLTLGLGGSTSLEEFGKQMVPFGESLSKFASSVSGIKDAEHVKNAAAACKYMAEAAKAIPNDGGLASLFAGDNNIGKFGEDIKTFGAALVNLSAYGQSIVVDNVNKVADSCVILAKAAEDIPNDGGVAGLFAGNNNIAAFGESVNAFGSALVSLSSSGANVNVDYVKNVANSCVALAKAAEDIPNKGGIASLFTGDNNIAAFGKDVDAFGNSLVSLSAKMAGVDVKNITNVSDIVGGFTSMASNISSANLSTVTNSLAPFGGAVKGFTMYINEIDATTLPTKAAAVKLAIANLCSINYSNITNTFKNVTNSMIGGVNSMFQTITMDLSIKRVLLSIKFKSMLDGVVSAIKLKQTDFRDAGKYLVEGFASGIDDSTWIVEAKAKAMAEAALEAARDVLDINSPSKKFYEVGEYGGIGLVNALNDYSTDTYDAGYNMGERAKSGLSNAISQVRDLIEYGIDDQPTIRPVLDLTNVNDGINAISRMFNANPSLEVMSNVGAISSSMNGIQNGGNDDVISAINDLKNTLGGNYGDHIQIGDVTYADGSEVSNAVKALARAITMERRV